MGLTKVTFVTRDVLLPKVGQTSIIICRNLFKQKKSKLETKEKPKKTMGGKETKFILIFKLSFLFIYNFDIAK